MKELQDRILAEGRVLPGNIIKVDGFLNHRIDMALTRNMARELAGHFRGKGVTMVMTVEASGIALASAAAEELGVPLVFAKKAKSDNIEGGLVSSEIYSYTYKKKVTLIISAEWLTASDRVLVVDDFLANGEAIRGLVEIVRKVGAEVVGVGIAVEKGFQGGGDHLREKGIDVKSLAIIDKAEPGHIEFRENA